MPGTYSQIYIQIVFAVKGRQNLLQKPWREEVFKYIAGIIREKNQKPLIVNGVSDHVHILLSIRPSISISDLVRDIKNNSSKFINVHGFLPYKFSWQEGFGVFSYSKSDIGKVYSYIERQESHHSKESFKSEYLDFLKEYEIEFDEKYLFDWVQ